VIIVLIQIVTVRHPLFDAVQNQSVFLNNYKDYGFKDKSEMMRSALNLLRKEQELQSLRQSAELYVETYATDADLKALTDAAVRGWPE
jgi:hypothetical protein